MAIKDQNFYGLNVIKSLADLQNNDEALSNLGLVKNDLIKINGISGSGADRADLQALSNLTEYVQRSYVAHSREIEQQSFILGESADVEKTLRGNLEVVGMLGGSAIKFKYYDSDTDSLAIADISTSRVSSWSSTVEFPTSTSPIQYGFDVEVIGSVTAENIEIFSEVQDVIFPDSEEPTHKIETTINGETVYLYAMKNLPLIFEGEFRSLRANCELIQVGNVSWRIFYVDNPQLSLKFPNQGSGGVSEIVVGDSAVRRKNIEIYHNPNNYFSIEIPSAGIKTLPSAEILYLDQLNLSGNNINNFPNINQFAPSLTRLNLSGNDFTLGDTLSLRFFTNSVLDLLPGSLAELSLGNCFKGEITANLVTKFTSLDILDLSSSSFLQFFGLIPALPTTLTEINLSGNIFEGEVPSSIKNNTLLEVLDISNNKITDYNFSLSSNNLKTVNISQNQGLNIPNLSDSTTLEIFDANALPMQGATGIIEDPVITNALLDTSNNYKFKDCTGLKTLNFANSGVTGPIPKFEGNTSLESFRALNSKISGGYTLDPANSDYVINIDTFEDCANSLEVFSIRSSRLLDLPIHPEAFLGLQNLITLEIISFNNGVSGELPLIYDLNNAATINLSSNRLTGTVWPSINSPNLFYLDLSNNLLTGETPAYSLNNLQYLYLNNNGFTKFNAPRSNNLINLFLQFNELTGVIPNLSDPAGANLENLVQMDLSNNNLNDYVSGSFANLSSLLRLDVSANDLPQASINAIINDLYINYENNNRSGVIVNLAGNAQPGPVAVQQVDYLRTIGRWSVTI